MQIKSTASTSWQQWPLAPFRCKTRLIGGTVLPMRCASVHGLDHEALSGDWTQAGFPRLSIVVVHARGTGQGTACETLGDQHHRISKPDCCSKGQQIGVPGVTKGWCLVPSSEWSSWAPLTSNRHPFVTPGSCTFANGFSSLSPPRPRQHQINPVSGCFGSAPECGRTPQTNIVRSAGRCACRQSDVRARRCERHDHHGFVSTRSDVRLPLVCTNM